MSRQFDQVFATLIGDVVPGPIRRKGAHRISSMQIVINNTIRESVFWRNALGITITEPPGISGTDDEAFYITIEYQLADGVEIDARDLLNEIGLPDNHAERKGIVKALQGMESDSGWYHQRMFNYTIAITKRQLDNAGGVVYLNDLDLVVGYDQHRSRTYHPFSPPGTKQHLSANLIQAEGFTQQYLLVDNARAFGDRWMNTGFGIYELKALADPRMRDGVYITTRVSTEKEPTTTYYVLTDAEKKLGLYCNRAEAETFGSPESRFHQEIKEMEMVLAREKAVFAKAKQDAERQKHEDELVRKRHIDEMERTKEKLEWERSRLELERSMLADKQKFDYDQMSRERKDRSDALKTSMDIGKAILGILSISLSIYALVKKNQK